MMDPLSSISAVITLIYVPRTVSDFYRQIKNAPMESELAGTRIRDLPNKIQLYQDYMSYLENTPGLEQDQIESAHNEVITLIEGCKIIQKELLKLTKPRSKMKRFRWVLVDKSKYDWSMNELHQLEAGVYLAFDYIRTLRQDIERNVLILTPQHENESTQIAGSGPQTRQLWIEVSTEEDNGNAVIGHANLNDSKTIDPWHSFGIPGIFNIRSIRAHADQGQTSTFASSIEVQILFSRLNFNIYLLLQYQFSRRVINLALEHSYFSSGNLVSQNCTLMTAIRAEDLVEIRRLLQCEDVSVHDQTDLGDTALSQAIETGNLSVVKLLFDFGADVNRPFGQRQTSPLAWALMHRHLEMSRFLVARGACYHHLSAFGWSALFYLWSGTIRYPISTEFIEMLRERESEFHQLHQGIIDTEGWGLMHRVAVLAVPQDIITLTEFGVDAFQRAGPFDWTPLHTAVYSGDYSNFYTLLSIYQEKLGHDAIELRDSKGWTCLHLAVVEGHTTIIRALLERGANWRTSTNPIDFGEDSEQGSDLDGYVVELPRSLEGKSCSALDLAQAMGPTVHRMFLDMIHEDIPAEGVDSQPGPASAD